MTPSNGQESFPEQQIIQRKAIDSAEQAVVKAGSLTKKWPEHRVVLTSDFASLLGEWRQKLRQSMTHVSFSPVLTAQSQLQRMRHICLWNLRIWRLRIEIAGLWWRIHWFEVLVIGFAIFGIGILILMLTLLYRYWPAIQDILQQLFSA